jgi:hypothetical protein
MKLIFRQLALTGILSVLLISACSTSKTATKSSQSSMAKKHMPWYKEASQFSKQDQWYYATGMSISTDSLVALDRAKKQARAQLNFGIQKDIENLRQNIESEEGNHAIVARPSFIWMIRGATNYDLKHAVLDDSMVLPKNGIYQAYAKLKYSQKQVTSDLMNALSSVKKYQDSVANSKAYKKWSASITSGTTGSSK